MANAASRREADEHVRDIRRRKGVDNPEGAESDNVRDLDRTLKILSDQLYEKETHFLLELIQNADDNTFQAVTPCLSFTCKAGSSGWTLEIECNEIGFKPENVEALCRIGDSTKKVDERTQGFIGEKGIGFKSVFKVANIVRIHSKAYSFMLDRMARLGMIAPIVDRSPWQISRDEKPETCMLLELNNEANSRAIMDELLKLDPRLLIFLRKISKMHVTTPDQQFEFTIWRNTHDYSMEGKETVTLISTSSRASLMHPFMSFDMYLIIRHQEPITATDTRRPNIKETEVVLAFPFDSNKRPVLRSQHTYAYLPINDYGFKFLIQGDFLLVANRESVDSSKWNDNILAAVYHAFVYNAVPCFNAIQTVPTPNGSSGGLRYNWPLYLKGGGETQSFWSQLNKRIFSRLTTSKVLESRHRGQLCRPETLYYIPANYRFQGEPLIEDNTSNMRHLSFAYDTNDIDFLPILEKMGVKIFTIHDLVQALRDAIAKHGITYLENQSLQWHSKIANLLHYGISYSHVLDLPLVPLRDGRWVSVRQGHVFLDEDTSNSSIPAGLDIHLVQTEACQDPERNAFFHWLGIKKCDRAEVCRMIIERYSPLQPRNLTDAVDDVIYLFQTRRSPRDALPSFQNLLFIAGPSSSFKMGCYVYVEEPNTTSLISKYAVAPETDAFPLLNPLYTAKAREIGRELEFVHWLRTNFGVASKPRLVDSSRRRNLTKEFYFLCTHASRELLVFLRDNWDFYALDLESTDSILNKHLSRMEVLRTDGAIRPLDQTMLPHETLMAAAPNITPLDIPDGADPRWNKLAHLGVLCSRTLALYRRQLRRLSHLNVVDTTKAAAEAAYAGLQSSLSGVSAQVKKDFKNHKLIFNPELNRWTSTVDCVWSGPELKTSLNLSSHYPRFKTLFHNYLEIKDADANHIIKEIYSLNTTQFERAKELLLQLNSNLDGTFPNILIQNLRGGNIFPVRSIHGVVTMVKLEDVWYIADRLNLRKSFDGRLPLLDFDVKTIRVLQPLIRSLNQTAGLLSTADKPKLERVGTPIYDEQKSMDLRKRAVHFISLLTESTLEDKTALLRRFQSLKVWHVPSVRLTHKVDNIIGAEEKGSIVFDYSNSQLDIYISQKDSTHAIVTHELSRQFIQHCGIPNERHSMVGAILNFPIEELRSLLDQHGLDEAIDDPEPQANLDRPAHVFDLPGAQLKSPRCDVEVIELVDEDDEEEEMVEISRQSFAARKRPNSRGTRSSHNTTNRPRSPDLNECLPADRRHAAPVNTMPNPRNTRASHSSAPMSYNNEGTMASGRVTAQSQATFAGTGSNPFSAYTSDEISGAQAASNRPRDLTQVATEQDKHIGQIGEKFVNDWLARELPDWKPTLHWTSKNRDIFFAGTPFTANEKDFADFTYADSRGDMTNLFKGHGFLRDVDSWLKSPPTYHLEVKSTTSRCDEPFYMSNNQVEKARGWALLSTDHAAPANVYVVLRVYNLEKQIAPGFKAFVDPWSMYLKRELNLFARGDYAVTAAKDEMDLT